MRNDYLLAAIAVMTVLAMTGTAHATGALTFVSVTSSNQIADQGQGELITINVAPGDSNTPFTYTFLVTNSTSNVVIVSANQLSTSNSNSLFFTIPLTSNALGTLDINGNVVDSTSNVAVLTQNTITVSALPTVTITNPSLAEDTGNTVTFTTTNTIGSGSDTYQWYNITKGSPISGATGTSLSITAGATASTYTYNVVISDSNGAHVSSNTGTLVVSALPTVTITNPSLAEDTGNTVTFTTTNTIGSGSDTYQWYNITKGSPISGATGTSLSITAGATASTYTYNVVISDSNGAHVSSNTGTLVVSALPTVTITNPSLAEDTGNTVTFTTTNTIGSGSDTYQWYNITKGSPISGATGTSLSIPAGATASTYTYNVVISDSNGAHVSSNTGTLVVSALPTVTITNPSLAEDTGNTVTFTTTNTIGSGSDTYQWYNITKGSPISGATGTSLSIPAGATASTYTYNVVISDSNGAHVSSNTGTVTVNSLPTITISPASRSINAGQSVTFTNVTSGGSQPYTFAYTVNSLSGVTITGNTITFANAGTFNVLETVTDNVGGAAHSANSVISVNPLPTLNAFTPSNAILDFGQGVTYTVTSAGGTGPFTYNLVNTGTGNVVNTITELSGFSGTVTFGSNIPAQGTDVFNAVATDSGASPKIVFGSTSNTITVKAAPTIGVSASSTSINAGQAVTFTANIPTGLGVGPFTVNLIVSGGTVATSSVPVNGGSNTLSYTFDSSGTFSSSLAATDIGTGSPFVFDSSSVSITVALLSSGGSGTCSGNNCATGASSPSPSTTTTTTVITTTTAATTTVIQQPAVPKPVINLTNNESTVNIDVSGNYSQPIYFGNVGVYLLVSSNSQGQIRGNVTAVNDTFVPPGAPQNYTEISEINITAPKNTTIMVTMHYNCSVPSSGIVPYTFSNGAWTEVQPFTVSAAACTVTFSVPSDPVIALFFAPPQPLSSSPAAAVNSTTSIPVAPAPLSGSIAIYAILAMVVIIVAVGVHSLLAKKGGKKKKG